MNQQQLGQSLGQSLDISRGEAEKGTSRTNHREPVFLNLYNFSPCFNCMCGWMGLGVYHTGIEVYGYEYMYFGFDGDDTGVGYLQPRTASYQFREQQLLGYTEYKLMQIQDDVLDPLRLEFIGRQDEINAGNRYDLLNFNCNHFSRRFTQMLQVQEVPPFVFTITDFFDRCRCCIPNCILNGRLDWFYSDQDDYESLQQSRHVSFRHDTSH